MDRIWLRHYPPGVPADIDASRYTSLVAMFEESFARFAAREACVCMGRALTYAAIDEASRGFAAFLQARGIKRGARVALMMPNVLQYPVAIAGALRAGCTVVNVNPLYKPRELEFQLKDSGAEAIVVLENFASVLQEALPQTPVKHVVIASMGDMLGTMKGALVNGVVRHVKKMVPRYDIPGSIRFNDALAAGRRAGFTRVFFLNGHGGNETPAAQALTELVGEDDTADAAHLAFASWWQLARDSIAPARHGMATPAITHACEYETSLMLALRPDLVNLPAAHETPAPLTSPWYHSEYGGGRLRVFHRFHRLTPAGSMGRPTTATPAKGASLLDAITADVLAGLYPEETQVPSTTELAAHYRINPATAGKALNLLVDAGIVYKKRGLGMFVAAGAPDALRRARRRSGEHHRDRPRFRAKIVGESKLSAAEVLPPEHVVRLPRKHVDIRAFQ